MMLQGHNHKRQWSAGVLVGLAVIGSIIPCITAANYCKGKKTGRYKDPTDCKKYYVCDHGHSTHETCNDGLKFNADKEVCDWPRNVDCSADPPPKVKVTDAPTPKKEATTKSHTKPKVTNKPNAKSKCGRVVCYFTNWAQYRKGAAKQTPEDIDPFMCTHVIFAFAKLDGNKLATVEWNDLTNYKKMMAHKEKNPHLKVLLAVGGWNMGTATFVSMTSSKKSRKYFIDSSINFLRENNFDGLDLDWEYPKQNKDKFSLLVKELKRAFEKEAASENKPRLLLTAAVSVNRAVVESAYEVPLLNAELDWINLMSYDIHGSWDGKTGHNSPLYAGSWEKGNDMYLNVNSAANNWVKQGASREKLVIGIPLYGRSFTLKSNSKNGLGALTKGAGTKGANTAEGGFLSYYEVCDLIKKGATKKFIKDQKVPYVVKGDQWVGYDNPASVTTKVNYVLNKGFGGVMVWDISLDDIEGEFCDEGKYPIMNAINKACGSK